MSNLRQSLGRWGESIAAQYLESQDYKIRERNARTPYGEIDIVALQPLSASLSSSDLTSVTIFVEVKTRSSTTYGFPEESITARKQAHMLAAAQSYMQENPDLGNDWRIDVIAIQCWGSRKKHSIRHFENVLT
jgi:putative endonuclease